MSYMSVLQALEPGDYVTFNDSGGSNGRVPPELCVRPHTNSAIVELENEGTGELWRVIQRDGALVMQYDRNRGCCRCWTPDWKDYDDIETLELIAE